MSLYPPLPDSRLEPSQWETSLQSNAVSHWLGANLESALAHGSRQVFVHNLLCPLCHIRVRHAIVIWCRLGFYSNIMKMDGICRQSCTTVTGAEEEDKSGKSMRSIEESLLVVSEIFLQTTNQFPCMRTVQFRLEFNRRSFLLQRVQLASKPPWLGAEQATSHYLNPWWPSLLTHIVTRSRWASRQRPWHHTWISGT